MVTIESAESRDQLPRGQPGIPAAQAGSSAPPVGRNGGDWGDGSLANSLQGGEAAGSLPASLRAPGGVPPSRIPAVRSQASDLICHGIKRRLELRLESDKVEQQTQREMEKAFLAGWRSFNAWPVTIVDHAREMHRLHIFGPAQAACFSLTSEDDGEARWSGQRQRVRFVDAIEASEFLEYWGRTSDSTCDDITACVAFSWRGYVLGLQRRHEVIGPGVSKFFVAEITHLSDPERRTRSLVAFIVLRVDGSQVRIQLHGHHRSPTLLYVDRPGPRYYGHIARDISWPRGKHAECQLLPGATTGALSDDTRNAIVIKEGWKGLYDTVTNVEARTCLAACHLVPDQVLDLSDGALFPWVSWVHDKEEIMEVIRSGTGVVNFAAAAFNFHWARRQSYVTAVAFRIELMPCGGPTCLLVFPLPERLFVMEINPDIALSKCCDRHTELQELLASEFYRDQPREPVQATFDEVPWGQGRLDLLAGR